MPISLLIFQNPKNFIVKFLHFYFRLLVGAICTYFDHIDCMRLKVKFSYCNILSATVSHSLIPPINCEQCHVGTCQKSLLIVINFFQALYCSNMH